VSTDALALRRRRTVRRLAAFGAVLVLAVTTLSAFLRLDHIGLGCADWPACYGQAAAALDTAKSVTVIAARLFHRVAALAALVVVLVLLLVSYGNRPILRGPGAASILLLLLSVFLTVLGIWTTANAPPAVTLGNLLGGFAMVGLFWWTRLACSEQASGIPSPPAPGRLAARLALVVLMGQIALGGLTSATLSGLSCTTLPDCQGVWWAVEWSASSFDPFRAPEAASAATPGNAGAPIHMAHRLLAVTLLVILGAAAWPALRSAARPSAIAALALVAAQIALGAAMVTGSLPIALAVAHSLLSGLLLCAVVGLASVPPSRP
jgi:cytochrome c oxidase assembly protein subunit 15